MKDNRQVVYIRLLGFSEAANMAVNKAIIISADEKCEDVNTVHLFLALLDRVDLGKLIIKHLHTSYDTIFSSYQALASQGSYGYMDSSHIEFDERYFSKGISGVFAECIQRTFTTAREISPELLFNVLLESESSALMQFLEYIGITLEEIEKLRISNFEIPDPLSGFVEDLNSSEAIVKATYGDTSKYTSEMIEILSRKTKANPCLIGEAGVGKTSIVYSLVQQIVNGKVPESFKDTHICYINGAMLTSGTRYRGDFEARIKYLFTWASKVNVILFLDEIHTFINCGKNGDSAETAGNMIKKYLSDGSIRIIGATTLKEYHQYIEKDFAFDRRLQQVLIKEPSVKEAEFMIKSSITDYENFHKLKITDEDIKLAVTLSDRYMKDKFLPDKAYTILDQACAKAKLAGNKTVTESDITSVVSKITGIEIGKLNEAEQTQLINLEKTIGKSLIGQANAISTVSKAIRRAKTDIHDTDKPLASFLFVGPTGVGKTELCKVLSKEVAVGDTKLIKIDMSEYSEKASISKLIGSAPGYVGYGEGGQLTEKVKHNPYSIVLFDEIEKAHPEVFNTFLQLLDEGRLTDGEGHTVDFTNCIVVMTSNAGYGADGINKSPLGFNSSTKELSAREIERKALTALEETFKPEFLNRIDNVVVFDKLTKEQTVDITKLMLKKLSTRLLDKGIHLTFDKSLVNKIVEDGYSDKYGARNLRREIQDTVEDVIADALLSNTLYNGCRAVMKYNKTGIKIQVKEGGKQ